MQFVLRISGDNHPKKNFISIYSIVTTKSFKEYGCFVAVILSHGTADETIFAYDKPFHLNKTIINPISTNPSLIGKPKIFIIATCRGDQQDQYFPKQGDRLETDSVPFTEQSSIPYYRDILKCYSTYEGRKKRHFFFWILMDYDTFYLQDLFLIEIHKKERFSYKNFVIF